MTGSLVDGGQHRPLGRRQAAADSAGTGLESLARRLELLVGPTAQRRATTKQNGMVRVRVWIPLAAQMPGGQPAMITALVVDDEPRAVDRLATMLEESGCNRGDRHRSSVDDAERFLAGRVRTRVSRHRHARPARPRSGGKPSG